MKVEKMLHKEAEVPKDCYVKTAKGHSRHVDGKGAPIELVYCSERGLSVATQTRLQLVRLERYTNSLGMSLFPLVDIELVA